MAFPKLCCSLSGRVGTRTQISLLSNFSLHAALPFLIFSHTFEIECIVPILYIESLR